MRRGQFKYTVPATVLDTAHGSWNREAPASAHRQADGELRRMALLADRYVRAVRDGLITPDPEKGDTVAMEPRLGDPDQKES